MKWFQFNHHSSITSPLNQFDIVPKRVSKVKPLVPGDLRLVLDRQLCRLDLLSPAGEVGDFVRDVCPCGALGDTFFHADVQLAVAGVEPEAVALEDRRPL